MRKRYFTAVSIPLVIGISTLPAARTRLSDPEPDMGEDLDNSPELLPEVTSTPARSPLSDDGHIPNCRRKGRKGKHRYQKAGAGFRNKPRQ